MATAEEILAAANGVDGQSVLVIDNDLRVIAIPDDVKLLGVESDDDVRRLHFSMPRQYGEVDLSGFAVRINYINANSEGDVYTVGDAQTDGDRITFSWLIGRHAARYAGNVQFIVCLKRFEGGEVVQEYNTTVAALPVLKGLETDEAVARENPDVIEDILLRLSALEQGGGYYVPGVDAAGNLSWTASKEGMPGVAGANIKGAKGEKGEDYVLTESDKAEIAGMVEVTLPIAGADTLGGVKPVAKTGGMTQEVGVDADGGLWTMAGGGGGEWELVCDETIEEETTWFELNNLSLAKVAVYVATVGSATNDSQSNGFLYLNGKEAAISKNFNMTDGARRYAVVIAEKTGTMIVVNNSFPNNTFHHQMGANQIAIDGDNKRAIEDIFILVGQGEKVFGVGTNIKIYGVEA